MLTKSIKLGRNYIFNTGLVIGSEWKGQVGGHE
jgi:hypothetical protein